MVRLGLMAMAARLRPTGQSRAAAAAEERRTQQPSLGGNYNPGRLFYASFVDEQHPRQEQSPTVCANGVGEKNSIIEEAIIDVHGNTFQKNQRGERGERRGIHPTVEKPMYHEDAKMMTYKVGAGLTSAANTVVRKGTGCSLALTSLRPARPRCA